MRQASWGDAVEAEWVTTLVGTEVAVTGCGIVCDTAAVSVASAGGVGVAGLVMCAGLAHAAISIPTGISIHALFDTSGPLDEALTPR